MLWHCVELAAKAEKADACLQAALSDAMRCTMDGGARGLGSARRVLRYWPVEATAAAGVLDKRELEGRVRHRCTASAVHDDSMTTARAVKECEGEYAVLEGA